MTLIGGVNLGLSPHGAVRLGVAQPAQDFSLRPMPKTASSYIGHLYTHKMVFKRTLGGVSLLNKPGLKLTQNGSYQQIVLEVKAPITGIALGDVIQLTEQGDLTGQILFTGNVETTPEQIASGGTHHQLVVTPWGSELGDSYFNQSYTILTDVAQFVRDAVAQTAHCSVSPVSCPNSGIQAIYDFQQTNPLDAIHVAKQIAGSNFFWFCDAQGVVWFQPVVTQFPAVTDTITKIQAGAIVAESGLNITLTLPVAATPGNCLVAFIAGGQVSHAPAGWQQIMSAGTSYQSSMEVWVYPNCSAVSSQVFNFYSVFGDQCRGEMSEWSHAVSAFPVETSGVDFDSSGTATTVDPTASSPTENPGDMAIACLWASGGVSSIVNTMTFTTPTGFTRVQDNGATSTDSHLDIEAGLNPAVGLTLDVPLSTSVASPLVGALILLKASGVAAKPRPATVSLRRSQFTSKKESTSIVGMRNKIVAIGGANPGDPGRIKATYDGAASQDAYGVRSINPTLSYPTVTDLYTLNLIVASLGQQYDRELTTAELDLPNLGLRLTPGRVGGLTISYWEPTSESLDENSPGAGVLKGPFVLQDVEWLGVAQKAVLGDIPYSDTDTDYEAIRSAQRLAVIGGIANPIPTLTPQPPAPTTTVYGRANASQGIKPKGAGIVTLATATFTTTRAGTCQVVSAVDARMEAWSNFVAVPRRALRATLSGAIFTGAWQELPFGLARATYDLSSASGIALPAGTYTVKIEMNTQAGNQMHIYSGYVQVEVVV